MINIAIIDQQVAQHGRFCLVDWLLGDNLLYYSDYEDWRYGKQEFLSDKIQLTKDALVTLLDSAGKYCQSLGLISESQEFVCWDAEQSIQLRANKNATYHQQLTQRWLRPQDQPQLDLFMDNSAQLAEAEVLSALVSRQFELAQRLLQKLSEINPESTRLGGYQDLINYGLHMVSNSEIAEDAISAEEEGLKLEVVKLAQEILGNDSRDYLSFAWRRLANNFSRFQFDSTRPDLHASAALMAIPDYAAAVESLNLTPELYDQPELLSRLAQCYHALHKTDNAFVVWCLMIEKDQEFTASVIDDNQSLPINAIWQDFWELEGEWEESLFPSYVLLRNPALVHSLNHFPSLSHVASEAVIELLKVRARGDDEIEVRAELQRVNPMLLKVYLKLNRVT